MRTHDSPRSVDKMPDNYLYLSLLALVFPRATLIRVRRDPRDVALSCWLTNVRSIRWASDPDHLSGRIREHRRIMDHWHAVLPAYTRLYTSGSLTISRRRRGDW